MAPTPADASGAVGGGFVDEGGYEDMRLYQNVGAHPDRPGVDASGAVGGGFVDEGGYEDMRLYQNVARIRTDPTWMPRARATPVPILCTRNSTPFTRRWEAPIHRM